MAAPPLPEDYLALYAQRGDDLEGDYAPLYHRYLDFAGVTRDQLWARTVQSSSTVGVPKVYAFLGEDGGNDVIMTLHRPTLFRRRFLS